MRYWDSSALLPLLVQEATSARLTAEVREDPAIVTWWGTRVECVSAIARLARDGHLPTEETRAALARLDAMSREWTEVPAIDDVRVQASRLLRIHRLRAADALQLAAAIVACDFSAASLPLLTLDVRLADVALLEGFPVIGW
jgi:predicted nucleic acid-binding protein